MGRAHDDPAPEPLAEELAPSQRNLDQNPSQRNLPPRRGTCTRTPLQRTCCRTIESRDRQMSFLFNIHHHLPSIAVVTLILITHGKNKMFSTAGPRPGV